MKYLGRCESLSWDLCLVPNKPFWQETPVMHSVTLAICLRPRKFACPLCMWLYASCLSLAWEACVYATPRGSIKPSESDHLSSNHQITSTRPWEEILNMRNPAQCKSMGEAKASGHGTKYQGRGMHASHCTRFPLTPMEANQPNHPQHEPQPQP